MNFSVEFAKRYSKANSIHEKVSYQAPEAKKCMHLVHDADICIVDTPRKGLGKELITKMMSSKNISEIIYVFYNFEMLASDLTFIQQNYPHWSLKYAASYLFFPGTNHIETILFLQKGE